MSALNLMAVHRRVALTRLLLMVYWLGHHFVSILFGVDTFALGGETFP